MHVRMHICIDVNECDGGLSRWLEGCQIKTSVEKNRSAQSSKRFKCPNTKSEGIWFQWHSVFPAFPQGNFPFQQHTSAFHCWHVLFLFLNHKYEWLQKFDWRCDFVLHLRTWCKHCWGGKIINNNNIIITEFDACGCKWVERLHAPHTGICAYPELLSTEIQTPHVCPTSEGRFLATDSLTHTHTHKEERKLQIYCSNLLFLVGKSVLQIAPGVLSSLNFHSFIKNRKCNAVFHLWCTASTLGLKKIPAAEPPPPCLSTEDGATSYFSQNMVRTKVVLRQGGKPGLQWKVSPFQKTQKQSYFLGGVGVDFELTGICIKFGSTISYQIRL